MPDKKINQFVSATTPLTGTELVPIVQEGVNVKATTQDIADLANTIGAVYESNVPFNDIGLMLNSVDYLPSEILNGGRKIVVYSNQTLPISLSTNGVLQDISQNVSLRWTNGGGLNIISKVFNSGSYLSILETPKIATELIIEGGQYRLSTFNFTTEHISKIRIIDLLESPSLLDLSSLKSVLGININGSISGGGPPFNQTIDLSGLESFGNALSSSDITIFYFGQIILPTNLKSASRTFNFTNCSLSQENVDAILQMLVNLDGTGDKQLWEGNSNLGCLIDLSGYCAPPSAAGLVNRAILLARNYVTVFTN